MDRNPISDLEAVAAMPGLEVLAEVIAEYVKPGRGSAADPMSMLIFAAGRLAFGSANVCDSILRSTAVWESLRASAASVGRHLPEKPPTFDQLHHLRRAADEGLGAALAAALPSITVPLAQSMGMLDADQPSPWHKPAATNVIYGDGSIFDPFSDATCDDDGVLHGSRATARPRFAPGFSGKEGPHGKQGLPIALVGCHGRERWKRVILGIDLYRDGNEIGSTLDLFESVISEAGGGVTHVVYDRLMSGTHVRRLMKRGVVPVVAMPEANERFDHVVLPPGLRRSGYSSAGRSKEKRKGKGARRRSGDAVAPKSRLSIHELDVVEHEVGLGTCVHELFALDGAVVAIPAGGNVTVNVDYVDCVTLRWEEHADGSHPIGTLRVPCRHGHVRTEIDFAGDRTSSDGKRKKNKHGELLAMADWVRPIPEAATYFSRTEGLRSDVESVFSWLKAMLPRERVSSLDPDHFVLDLVGGALLCNAIAWDVHVATHTEVAKDGARRRAKRLMKRPAA